MEPLQILEGGMKSLAQNHWFMDDEERHEEIERLLATIRPVSEWVQKNDSAMEEVHQTNLKLIAINAAYKTSLGIKE